MFARINRSFANHKRASALRDRGESTEEDEAHVVPFKYVLDQGISFSRTGSAGKAAPGFSATLITLGGRYTGRVSITGGALRYVGGKRYNGFGADIEEIEGGSEGSAHMVARY